MDLLLNHLFNLDDALFAKEHLVTYEEGRHTKGAAIGCLLGVMEQRVFHRLGLNGLNQRCGIQPR